MKAGCISCVPPNLFYFGSCLPSCPPEYYNDGVSPNCLPCPYKCESCTSTNNCLTCLSGYYLVNDETNYCTLAGGCPDGTYPDFDMRKCFPCHKNCLTCTGDGENQCLTCNYTLGLFMSTSEKKCIMLHCAQGEFIIVNDNIKAIYCEKCHPTCLSCDSPEAFDCILCNKDYIPFPGSKKNRFQCKTCKEISSGYEQKMDENGHCVGKSYKLT